MLERDRYLNWPNANKNSPYKYLGSAIILALATAIFYLSGMIYLISYFNRFSYTYLNLNTLPTIFALPILSIIAMNILMLILIYELNNGKLNTYSDRAILHKFYNNLQKLLIKFREGTSLSRFKKTFFISIILYAIIGFYGYHLSIYFLSNKSLLAMIYFYIMAYLFAKGIRYLSIKDITHIFLKFIGAKVQDIAGEVEIAAFNLIFFILLIISISNVLLLNTTADQCASNLVEGIQGSSEVKLYLNNDSSYNLPCNTFILVMQQEGCLYLVEKKIPAPKHSTLYMVPVTKINHAAITLISEEKKPISHKEMFYNLTNSTSNLFNSIKPYLNTSPKNNASLAIKEKN